MPPTEKRSLMVSNVWIQAAAIVLLIGFFIMGVLTYYTYNDEPPIPEVVKSETGAVLFTPHPAASTDSKWARSGAD